MNRTLYFRLSAMMFLLFFIAGAFTPVMSLYLVETLGFSGSQAGAVLSLTAIGSMAAPLFTAAVADRFIRAERLLGACNLVGGVLILLFARQHSFLPAAALFLGHTLVTMPTFALANAVAFHHFPDMRHRFGAIRVWGTIGWIAVAWLIGVLWLRSSGNSALSRLPEVFTVAAVSSFIAGIYAFTLPASRQVTAGAGTVLPLDALRLFKNGRVLQLCLFMLFVSIMDRFYYFGTAPFLRTIGFRDRDIMPTMSLGQLPEVFAMGVLAWLLLRYGSKKIILLGLALDILRFSTAALGGPSWLVIAGLSFHGLAYTFIYTTASIQLDRHCDAASRTGAHQIFGMTVSGIGGFTGSILCGAAMDVCGRGASGVNYHAFWLIPVTGLSLLFIIAFYFFKADRGEREKQDEVPQLSAG